MDELTIWSKRIKRDLKLPTKDTFGHRDYLIKKEIDSSTQYTEEFYIKQKDEDNWTKATEIAQDFNNITDDPRKLIDEIKGITENPEYVEPATRMNAFKLSNYAFKTIQNHQEHTPTYKEIAKTFQNYLKNPETEQNNWYELNELKNQHKQELQAENITRAELTQKAKNKTINQILENAENRNNPPKAQK